MGASDMLLMRLEYYDHMSDDLIVVRVLWLNLIYFVDSAIAECSVVLLGR